MGAAMETIDEHRGILHGGADNCNYYFDDIYVIDLKEKVIQDSFYYEFKLVFGRNGPKLIVFQNRLLDLITDFVN